MSIILDSFNHPLNVVIVGASGGIGQALVECLVNHNNSTRLLNRVYGLSRQYACHTKNVEKATVGTTPYTPLYIDYADEESIHQAANMITQPVDILIVATGLLHNDNGIQPEKTYQQLSTDKLQQNFLVNTIGPALIAKYFMPKMRRQHKSIFTVLSARVGSISDNRLGGWYAYRSSKAALNMLLKTLSVEMARRSPTLIVAGLHPGTVATNLSQPFQKNVKPEQLFTPQQSALYLLTVINQLSNKDSGFCFAWDGQRIPE